MAEYVVKSIGRGVRLTLQVQLSTLPLRQYSILSRSIPSRILGLSTSRPLRAHLWHSYQHINNFTTSQSVQKEPPYISKLQTEVTNELDSTQLQKQTMNNMNFMEAAAQARKLAQEERKGAPSSGVALFPFAFLRTFISLGAILTGAGYVYSYCIEKKITFSDFLSEIMQFFENKQSQFSDYLDDLMDHYFPLTTEPLLADAKDLSIPDNIPTLVVDLDKVIAHLEHDRKNGWRVVKRPGADRFFKELMNYYEIVVWSDDMLPVANDVIMKWGLPVSGCLHRDQCKKRKGHYVKDLSRLGRNLEKTILIDHDPVAYMLQPENGILIREFSGDPDDTELDSLIDLLKSISLSLSDVRTTLKKYENYGTDIGRQFNIEQAEEIRKAESRRTIGRAFGFGSNSRTPNFGTSQNATTSSMGMR